MHVLSTNHFNDIWERQIRSIRRIPSVYVAFLDVNKAFDKICPWKLFRKLINRDVSLYLAMILFHWYQKQKLIVRCGACISDSFKEANGVCHGGTNPTFQS